MAGPADIGSKRLIGLAPDAGARWVTQQPDVRVEAMLSAEFPPDGDRQFVSRASDVLLRAVRPTLGPFLVLTELQLHVDPRMPRRIASYSMLGEEHFDLPVFPVVVNILPPKRGAAIHDHHEHTFLGLTTRREFRVIKL